MIDRETLFSGPYQHVVVSFGYRQSLKGSSGKTSFVFWDSEKRTIFSTIFKFCHANRDM